MYEVLPQMLLKIAKKKKKVLEKKSTFGLPQRNSILHCKHLKVNVAKHCSDAHLQNLVTVECSKRQREPIFNVKLEKLSELCSM